MTTIACGFAAEDKGVPVNVDILKDPKTAALSLAMGIGFPKPTIVFAMKNLSASTVISIDLPEVSPAVIRITTPTGKVIDYDGINIETALSSVSIEPNKSQVWRYPVDRILFSLFRAARRQGDDNPSSPGDYPAGMYQMQWIVLGCASNGLNFYSEMDLKKIPDDG